ncbi:hypothetical protein RvY_18734 [Ramazzottius varieornatus]|uniref:Uncharacterized protein n=1 Tax=Ramazzottius varieornatus TaxID=947166 RepID=A0A1D1W6U5_RAMVA|nr:hypothetical protein RvY_18734 [Ramazzottius varieornatus]
MSQHDLENQGTLNPGYPATVDPLQDALEHCMTLPASKRRDMSSYAARFVSYCNPYWPTRLWGMASSLAMAGFYFRRGFPAIVRCFYCDVQVEVRGNDVDPWVGHVQAAATCAFVINTRGIRSVNDVCSILRGHPATLYRGLESKQALLRRIRLHWPDDYGHAEHVLDLDATHDVVWSYVTLKRIEERKQTMITQEAMRDEHRA